MSTDQKASDPASSATLIQNRFGAAPGPVGPAGKHPAPPCTLVIFGAGGDLTQRLLMPALYNLSVDKPARPRA